MEISKGNNLPVRCMLVHLSWGIAATELHLTHENSLCISGTLTSWGHMVFRRWLRFSEVRGHSFSRTLALERELFHVKTELENGIWGPETESASNLNLNFQPTEVRENNYCAVYATQPVVFCYGNLSKVRDNHHRSEGDELISEDGLHPIEKMLLICWPPQGNSQRLLWVKPFQTELQKEGQGDPWLSGRHYQQTSRTAEHREIKPSCVCEQVNFMTLSESPGKISLLEISDKQKFQENQSSWWPEVKAIKK